MNQSHVSDRLLRSFVAAASTGSFTGAAATMGTSQSAVSHSVAKLEQALGGAVFERARTGVELTDRGQLLYADVADAYQSIDRAIERARRGADSATVTLSVSTSFASYWLMPRLADFKREHPEVELRLITNDADATLGRDDADLWIPLGALRRPDKVAHFLCDEELVPVASPSVAAGFDGLDPEALRAAPLLHLEERYEPRYDWKRWFAEHELEPPTDPAAYRTNDYSLIVQAALEGQGVALGWMHIVRTLVEQGRLVALADPIRTEQPFHILTSATRPLHPAAEALRLWLRSSVL